MRDVYTDFGTATTAASSAVATFARGINVGKDGNIGRIADTFITVVVEGSKAIPASEVLTFDVLQKNDTGAGTKVSSYVRPAEALSVGGKFSFGLPKDHLQYLSLQVTASATAGIVLHAYIERGEDK